MIFNDVVMAYSLDYECVFFVDVLSDNYATYAFHGNHENMKLSDTRDFWADTRVNLQTNIYEEDRKWFLENFSKEKVLPIIRKEKVFNCKYRLVVAGKPVWYTMKAVLSKFKQQEYLIIGINNIDEQERSRQELEQKASKSQTYAQIVMALAERYDALYMVDLDTNHFVQYRSEHEQAYGELSIAVEGDNFFSQLRSDARQVVYEDDVPMLLKVLQKDALLKEINEMGSFSFNYRVKSPKGPLYVNLVAVKADKSHLVISVTNIDVHVRREQELSKKVSKNEVYGRIVMALAERYDALYMVDLETNHYSLYKTERVYSELSVALEGEDFFNQLQKDAETVVFRDDVPLVQAALTREVLLRELDDHGVFTFSYRLNSPSGPLYVSLVAVYSDKTHVVISITNIDAQVRREMEIKDALGMAIEMSKHDDLTGIKNKNAYGELEAELNQQIADGVAPEFGIAICDVNGLKTVNDTQGHKAGDYYIQSAARLVCSVFKHSPVFRVGGDEFVAVLQGVDLVNRHALKEELTELVHRNAEEKKVVMACGISVYDRAHDNSVDEVFERADALMYKNKMAMKGGRDEILNAIIRSIGARTKI